MEALLVLPQLRVENANAIAGLTWGFPALSNFLGYCHALQRKLNAQGYDDIRLTGCGVVCHHHQVQAYRPGRYGDYRFALTRNPLTKEGKTPSFNEEGRMHLTVSLVIGIDELGLLDEGELQELKHKITSLAQSQRLAGGSILGLEKIQLYTDATVFDSDKERRKLLRSLLPGFALVSRQDLLAEHQQQSGQSSMDAWLDFSALFTVGSSDNDSNDKAQWHTQPKAHGGWLRPISVGYRAISKLYKPGEMTRSRDSATPSRFVESVYSLGQWLSPHRIQDIKQLFWYYHTDLEEGLYLCQNHFQAPEPVHELTPQ